MTTLPDKPSELIRVALADLRKCEAEPDVYEINMGLWHMPYNGVCHVCLAGAVLAQTIGVPPNKWTTGGDEDVSDVMCALDNFRHGDVDCGLDILGLSLPVGVDLDRDTAHYDRNDPAKFHADMERLAADLEAAGL